MTDKQLHEAADLISKARNTDLEDVESFLVALDRIDRWLALPAQHEREEDDDASNVDHISGRLDD